ncbi:hypothetical protein Tco_1407658 [Tanacetum coccineum]
MEDPSDTSILERLRRNGSRDSGLVNMSASDLVNLHGELLDAQPRLVLEQNGSLAPHVSYVNDKPVDVGDNGDWDEEVHRVEDDPFVGEGVETDGDVGELRCMDRVEVEEIHGRFQWRTEKYVVQSERVENDIVGLLLMICRLPWSCVFSAKLPYQVDDVEVTWTDVVLLSSD